MDLMFIDCMRQHMLNVVWTPNSLFPFLRVLTLAEKDFKRIWQFASVAVPISKLCVHFIPTNSVIIRSGCILARQPLFGYMNKIRDHCLPLQKRSWTQKLLIAGLLLLLLLMFMLLSLLAAFNTLYQVKAGTGFSMSMDNTNKTRMRIDKCEASTSERRQEDVLEKKC